MTVQIDTTAVINAIRLAQQGSSPSTPASGYELLYVISGSANGGLFTKDSSGTSYGPFVTAYPLDASPTSPSIYDDEFISTGLNSIWTNPLTSGTGQTLTLTVGSRKLLFEPATGGTGNTGKRVFGIRQNSPSGSFTVLAKVRGIAGNTGYNSDVRTGIFVAKTGGSAFVLGYQASGARPADILGLTGYSETTDWGTYDGSHNVFQNYSSQAPLALGSWYKLVYDSSGSTLTAYYSTDGENWSYLTQFTSITQPDRMGLCIYSNSATIPADWSLLANWFRVTVP